MAITEHWINQNTVNYYKIHNMLEEKNWWKRTFFYTMYLLQYDDENSITSITLKRAREKTVITCVYRPPDTNIDKHSIFLQILQRHLTQYRTKKVFIIGDLDSNNIVQNYFFSPLLNIQTINLYYLYKYL